MNRINVSLFEEKVGYDWANKKMIIRVYDALKFTMENYSDLKKNWTNTIRTMFVLESNEAGLKNIAINGYYSTIRTILKWDRFYSDEDWSWFKTSTQRGGWGEIVEPNGMPY